MSYFSKIAAIAARSAVPSGRGAELFVELVAAAGGVDDDDLTRLVGQIEERVGTPEGR